MRVLFSLLLLVANGVAPLGAEPVTIRSQSGRLELTGEVYGFDGAFLRLGTDIGEVTLRYDGVSCTGADCPNPREFVPELRLSGSARIAQLLIPSLIEGYAWERGLIADRTDIDAEHFGYSLRVTGSERATLEFALRATKTDEGFADLLAHEADVGLSTREVTPGERDLARETGIGVLDSAGAGRIVALDALVPIVSPRLSLAAIAIDDLRRIFSGQIDNWKALGGPDDKISLHLLDPAAGMTQAFVERVMDGEELVAGVTIHATP